MTAYRRPTITAPLLLDDDGRPIPFGDRWGDDGPPESAHGTAEHRGRFAPLHDVADALVDWLVAERGAQATPVEREPGPFGPVALRATRVDLDQVSVVVVWTGFPGVLLERPGADRTAFPPCGCDACDDRWEDLATHLEEQVLELAGGA